MVQELGISRLFFVTDSGLIKAKLIDGALLSLAAAKIHVTVFSEVLADPLEVSIDLPQSTAESC